MKKRLAEFENSIRFYIAGKKKQIVYCSEVNPCNYTVARLEGADMRDVDICLSVERMIRRHIEKYTGKEPLLFSELISNLKSKQPL